MASDSGAQNGHGDKTDPMHQFEIERYVNLDFGGLDFSFTNSSLWMVISVICASLLLAVGTKKTIPTRLQSIGELMYEFISDMVRDTMGEEGRKFFPFIFTLFTFILFCNTLGLFALPVFLHPFTVTSHIIVTFALAMMVWLGATVYGFTRHGLGYLKLFAPSGTPMILMPLLIVIEVLSYLSRPISLSVRLFANMMAGHAILKVFAGFVVSLGAVSFGILGIVPLAGMVAFTGLEFLVAFLQAFIFAMLSCMYINDAIHPHH